MSSPTGPSAHTVSRKAIYHSSAAFQGHAIVLLCGRAGSHPPPNHWAQHGRLRAETQLLQCGMQMRCAWLVCHWHFHRPPLLADRNGTWKQICVFVCLKGTLPTSRLQISTGLRGWGVCLWPLWSMDRSLKTTCDQSSRLIKEEPGSFCSHLQLTAWEEP